MRSISERDFECFASTGVNTPGTMSPNLGCRESRLPRSRLVNDENREVEGTLTLALEDAKGEQVAAQKELFKIAPLGQETVYTDFEFPQMTGKFLLRAIIEHRENGVEVSTQSRRRIKLVEPGQKQD